MKTTNLIKILLIFSTSLLLGCTYETYDYEDPYWDSPPPPPVEDYPYWHCHDWGCHNYYHRDRRERRDDRHDRRDRRRNPDHKNVPNGGIPAPKYQPPPNRPGWTPPPQH
jgi:hypothetical protein